MRSRRLTSTLAVCFFLVGVNPCSVNAQEQSPVKGAVVTLKGSLVCNGACIPDPKTDDHSLVLFAIDGTAEIRAEVERIVKELYPDKRLDADAAQKLMDAFSARLKFYIAPDSPALKDDKNKGKNHYW